MWLCVPAWAAGGEKAEAVEDPKLQAEINRAVERGASFLKRMQRRSGAWTWSYTLSGQGGMNFYFLYGLERAATLADAPPKEWYVENARDLVKMQQSDGGWRPTS